MQIIALYPGTFDPITSGHSDLVRRATRVFSQVIVAVAANPAKRPLFDLKQRVDLATRVLADIPGARVVGFDNLLIQCVRQYQAQVILQDAEAYRERVIAEAEGDASRFEALLVEYQKAPRVTRDRLYIEAVEEVYADSAKILIDTEGSGNLLYLPLNEIMNRAGIDLPTAEGGDSQATPRSTLSAEERQDTRNPRERRTRQ